MTPLETLLDRLPDVKKSGNGWSARCPAHDDRRPSLSIAQGDDGTVLIKCHAGCDTSTVLAAVDMELAELFPAKAGDTATRNGQSKTRGRSFKTAKDAVADLECRLGKRSAAWYYYNARGEPVGVVVRWDKSGTKEFRPVARHADGWRIAAMPEPRPLYGLLKLSKSDGTVLVVEGEKAADAALSIGILATTSVGGSNAAAKTDWTPLAGRDVVIMPDNDAAGQTYAETVGKKLAELNPPARPRLLDTSALLENGDIVDWLDSQGDAAEPDVLGTQFEDWLTEATPFPPSQALISDPSSLRGMDTAPHFCNEPQPIPDVLMPVPEFDYGLLPDAFRDFVKDVAERMQCPADFPAVALMVAAAGVIGRKIGIRPKKHDDWLVGANLWGIVVGRPGIMKSPAIREPARFLFRLQTEAKKEFENALQQYESEKDIAEIRKKQRDKAVIKAINNAKDPVEAAAEYPLDVPDKPVPLRFYVNDSTVEKLGELLNQNSNGLTIFRDEFSGFLKQLDKVGAEGARAFYLEAWNGIGEFYYDRIGRGTLHIESVTLSMIGSIQPGRLSEYLTDAVRGGSGDDGLIQRFQLLVYPDVSREWINVDRWPDTPAKNEVWTVFQELHSLDPATIGAKLPDEGDVDAIPFLRFAANAQKLFDDWRADLEKKVRSGDEHPAIESHLAKYRSLVPKLALIIHLVDGGLGWVSEDAANKAISWARYLEAHARRVYATVSQPEEAAAKALSKKILNGNLSDGFSPRDVYRKHWTGLSEKEDVERAIDRLIEHYWLMEVFVETGGRPKCMYRINPRLQMKSGSRSRAISAKSPQDSTFGTNGTPEKACDSTNDVAFGVLGLRSLDDNSEEFIEL